MGRSLKKGPFVNAKLLKAIEEMNAANDKKVIKTWSRPSTIFPQMVGHTIAVHDGKKARSRIYYRRHGRTHVWENLLRREPTEAMLPTSFKGR